MLGGHGLCKGMRDFRHPPVLLPFHTHSEWVGLIKALCHISSDLRPETEVQPGEKSEASFGWSVCCQVMKMGLASTPIGQVLRVDFTAL